MQNWIARLGRVRPRPPDLAAALTLLGGLAVAFAIAGSLRDTERERARADFLQRAETRTAAVARSFGDAMDVLNASNALFLAVGAVSREQFGAFVQPLVQSHPYLQAVVFQRVVEGAARADYEAAQARERPGSTYSATR
jgi:CHASE1-domain containing sensor protein